MGEKDPDRLMRALHPVPDTPPRAILYLRQSVARDDSISIELQEIAGRDYCTRQGYEVIGVEIDEGLSGRNWSKRPAVQRVIDKVEAREADIIVLWKWSRLSRSRKDWAIAADRVDIAGGRIESATEPIDTATASGRFARGVMTEYAAFQSEQIGEQWSEVHSRRFNLGLPPTGVPWGWTINGDSIEQNPQQAPYVARMYDLYLAGQGWADIARWLHQQGIKPRRAATWTGPSLRRLLDSPIHAGLVSYRGELKPAKHSGIISVEKWEDYRAMRDDRHVPKKHRKSDALLASLIVCECGQKRYPKTDPPKPPYPYVYRSYACKSSAPHSGGKSTVMWKIDQGVIDWVRSLPKIAADKTQTITSVVDTESLAREITANEKRLVKLTEHLVEGLVPEAAYRQTRDKIVAENEQLQVRLKTTEMSRRRTAAAYVDGQEELIATFDVLDAEAKQALVRSFISHVSLSGDRTVTIHSRWQDTAVFSI